MARIAHADKRRNRHLEGHDWGSAMKTAIPKGGFGESTFQKENEPNAPAHWS
jgi:hypothetical protein